MFKKLGDLTDENHRLHGRISNLEYHETNYQRDLASSQKELAGLKEQVVNIQPSTYVSQPC